MEVLNVNMENIAEMNPILDGCQTITNLKLRPRAIGALWMLLHVYIRFVDLMELAHVHLEMR